MPQDVISMDVLFCFLFNTGVSGQRMPQAHEVNSHGDMSIQHVTSLDNPEASL